MARPNALEEVTEAIDEHRSFLVEAGAGSGKTYSLVHGLHHILRTQRHDLERTAKQVACITYTNVAKQEILQRIGMDPLVFVGTIHEFLWEVIKNYQQEIKVEVLAYNNELKKPTDNLQGLLPALEISYSDRGRNYTKGRVSHDEVIDLSWKLFHKYPKIARLTADRFPILFIDEYQDTEKRTINLVLEHLLGAGKSEAMVGLFGDSMQKIYGTGVGVVKSDKLQTITKTENFRCSRQVIRVLNKMRPELQQVPAGDNVEGDVHFFSGTPEADHEAKLKAARSLLARKDWRDEETKI